MADVGEKLAFQAIALTLRQSWLIDISGTFFRRNIWWKTGVSRIQPFVRADRLIFRRNIQWWKTDISCVHPLIDKVCFAP